ncbi:GAF domain-containing protein [Vicingus serpentipes]|uniref:GAF domain-containing protein n=1 Tax=Vicingus serpentipes TaxID=1926625 RepID=A0A5C6RT49_9FLAO|nr:GAF domain-containing protein [Vicingus serpentipes]TXB64820.1 GAF domain-containing protein [Vicingus serpentipes]
MAEELIVSDGISKEKKYEELIPQIKALVEGESDKTANLCNIMSALKWTFNWLWIGVYIVRGDELVLGPFQGPIACTRIQLGRGVSGTAWHKKEVIIVPNVDEFPDHIICNSASKSEIVLPVMNKNGDVSMILDADSDKLNDFDEIDEKYLSQVIEIIKKLG